MSLDAYIAKMMTEAREKLESRATKGVHGSKAEERWLEAVKTHYNWPIIFQYRVPGIGWTDGYVDQDQGIFLEFHGDFWHGKGDPTKWNNMAKRSFFDLYLCTLDRELRLLKKGRLFRVYESEFARGDLGRFISTHEVEEEIRCLVSGGIKGTLSPKGERIYQANGGAT